MTKNLGKLEVSTPSEREIALTRSFNAPRRLVFDALTKPELLKRWMFGPPGWTFAVCEIDLRVGGAYRFVWSKSGGIQMGIRGVYREVVPPERVSNTEKFDEPWYPGEAIVTNSLAEDGRKTALTLSVLYESKEARDIALQSPMEQGVAMGFDRLAEIVEAP
jgi:uncharacterized protein YndB with AHSA1/START domain